MKRLTVPLLAVLALAGCETAAPDGAQSGNALVGNWRIELPTLPHSHGNEIGFREGCLIVGGDRVYTQVLKPAAYISHGMETYVWFGDAARTGNPHIVDAAKVEFLTRDRIEVI
ncbi:MAG: hypothetical protein VW618_11675, partial [Alphaproteobacteria bacterium]